MSGDQDKETKTALLLYAGVVHRKINLCDGAMEKLALKNNFSKKFKVKVV